jgi:outer membrane receptor for ferrienterochelin and colicins
MGVSASINHNFKFPLSFNLGVNFLNSTQTEEGENGVPVTEDLVLAPRMSGVFTANYRLPNQRITFAYTAQYTGVMALPEVYDLDANGNPLNEPRPTESEPFSLHQLQVTKIFNNNYTLYFGVNNLFNYVQTDSQLVGYDDPNYAPGFSPYFDTSYVYAPNHGREFYIGFKLDLDTAKSQVVAER